MVAAITLAKFLKFCLIKENKTFDKIENEAAISEDKDCAGKSQEIYTEVVEANSIVLRLNQALDLLFSR